MTQIKVHGRADPRGHRRDRLSEILHACVVEAFDYPQSRRAHRFFCLDAETSARREGRSESYTIIEISLFEGRSSDAKKRLCALVFKRLHSDLGLELVDVEIILTETARNNRAMRGPPGDELTLDYRRET